MFCVKLSLGHNAKNIQRDGKLLEMKLKNLYSQIRHTVTLFACTKFQLIGESCSSQNVLCKIVLLAVMQKNSKL